MVQQLLDLSINQRVQIPELVDLHQVGIITSKDEVRIIFEKQIGDVTQMHQSVERGGP